MKQTDIHSITLNLRYYLNVNYDEEHSCQSSQCDTICRCSKIVNATIPPQHINLHEMLDNLSINLNTFTSHKKPKPRRGKIYTPSKIEIYCIERLFSFYELYNTNNYDIQIVNGYYGEEIGAVMPKNLDNIIDDIKKILCFDNEIDKIKFVLNKEYSYLLDVVNKSTTVTIKHINASELYKNDNYFSRIKNNDCDYKLNTNLPIGVVYENNGSYRLIDGYHRTVLACGGNYPYIVIS